MIRIERLKGKDVFTFHKLLLKIFDEGFGYYPKRAQKYNKNYWNKTRLTEYVPREDILMLLARDGARAVGYLIGKYYESGKSLILWLGVISAYRGRGIGGNLVRNWERWSRCRGAYTLKASTANFENEKFYRSLGYQKSSKTVKNDWGMKKLVFLKQNAVLMEIVKSDTKYEKIAKRIIVTYENSYKNLDNFRQLHWFIRRYRVTGNKKYLPLILKNSKSRLAKASSTLKRLDAVFSARQMGQKILSSMKATDSRKAKRIILYKKNPELLVYMKILNLLFITKSLRLDKGNMVKKLYNNGLDFFKNNDVSKYFLSEEFISTNPSEAANMIYYLKYIGISDYEDKLLSSFKKYYLKIQPENSDKWLDKVYGFTHLIIAASNYYQNFIEKEKFRWIYDYFENNLEVMIKNTTPDVVAEVGICFKLCKDFKNPVVERIKKYLFDKFDETKGYIPREVKNSLSRAEHRNILAVMLLSDLNKLYPGPDLSSSFI